MSPVSLGCVDSLNNLLLSGNGVVEGLLRHSVSFRCVDNLNRLLSRWNASLMQVRLVELMSCC
jgi:hypothetical protein